MTRRDYITLAEALREQKPDTPPGAAFGPDPKYVQQHIKDCHAVANVCALNDPKFDRERFLRNCGVRT